MLTIMGRKPTTDTSILEIGVQPFGEQLIFARIADKARIELENISAERWQIFYKNIWQSTST